MTKKLTDSKHPFKRTYAKEYYTLAAEGLSLPEISLQMGIPEERLISWSKDSHNYSSFVRAFKAGRTACQAFHVRKLKNMTADGATQAQLQSQKFILQTLFPETWNLPTKQDIKVDSKQEIVDNMSDKELESRLEEALGRETTKQFLKNFLSDDSPELKIVKGAVNGKED